MSIRFHEVAMHGVVMKLLTYRQTNKLTDDLLCKENIFPNITIIYKIQYE